MYVQMDDYRDTGFYSWFSMPASADAMQADVDNMAKALTSGYALTNQTGGAALRVESLEDTLKVTTFREENLILWRKMPKSPAYTTIPQWNDMSSYGSNGVLPFVQEGELGQELDGTFNRRTIPIKYLTTLRSITMQMMASDVAGGDPVTTITRQGVMYLLEQATRTIYEGDRYLNLNNAESTQFDGLLNLIAPAAFTDLQGQSLTEEAIESAANEIAETGYGIPSDLFLGAKTFSDFNKLRLTRIRYPGADGTIAGGRFDQYMSGAGPIKLNPDVFIRQAQSPPAAATTSLAPASPGNVTTASTATGLGDFQKELGTTIPANRFCGYAVTACNRYGESAPFFANAGVYHTYTNASLVARDVIRLTITNINPMAGQTPDYFNVYRTNFSTAADNSTTVGDYSLIARVATSSIASGGTTTTDDADFFLPFTRKAYMLQLDPAIVWFYQLLPLFKFVLPPVAPAYRFAINLWGALVLAAPLKAHLLINIGDLT